MRKGLVFLILGAALVAIPVALALLPEQPVIAGPRSEKNPMADWNGTEEVLGWSRNRPDRPRRFDAWVKDGAEPAIKLNMGGQGWTAGMDYPLVVYQRILDGQSNLFLYDLSDGSRPPTPDGVNTERWEWHATISGNWLLFGRNNNLSFVQRIILHDMVAHTERQLSTSRKHFLLPGQVNGNWATFTRCAAACNVILYDIGAETRTTLPKPAAPAHLDQVGSSVTSAGTVYLVRSRRGHLCPTNVRIMRYGPSDPANGAVIARLPSGRDIAYTYARENPDGSVDVFYDRAGCRSGRWDVYKVTDP